MSRVSRLASVVLVLVVVVACQASVASATITVTGHQGTYAHSAQVCLAAGDCDTQIATPPQATLPLGDGGFTFSNTDAFAVAGAHLESAVAIADALVSGHGNASLAVAGDTMTFSFDALLSGSMNLNVLLPAQATNQLLASAGGGLTTQFNFTTTEPLTFEATGSVSADESYSQTAFTLVPTTGSNPQGLIAQTSRTPTSRKFAGGGTLPPGTYQVLARATTDPGISGPASKNLSITTGQTLSLKLSPASPCPAGKPEVQVGDAVAQGCFTERKDAQGAGTGVFETDEAAWVGGFPLQPRGGGRLVLVPTDQAAPLRAEGTGVDLVLGPLVVPAPLSEIKPLVASYVVGASAVDAFERLVALPFLKGSSGQVRVTWAPGGRGAKVEAKASIEEMTKVLGKAFAPAAGGSIGTLSGKLTLTLKNGEPADITKGELVIPAVSVEVKDTSPPLREGFGGATFKAQRVAGRVEWSGEVTVLFPWKNDAGGSNQGKITGRLFFTDGSIGGLGLAASGFEEPIGRTGWDLTGVDGSLILSPLLAFDFGVTAEQRSVFAGQKLFKLTGNVKGLRLAKPDCASGKNPFEFVGTANVPPMETAHIGKGKLRVLMCAYVPSAEDFAFEVGASADLSIDLPPTAGLLTAKGSATGWFRGAGSASSLVRADFNLDGNFEVKMPIFGTIAASGVLSSEGYAFCGTYGFITAGFATHNWVSLPGDLSGCDFTPYRVATSATASATSRKVRVPAGQSAVSIAVRGSGVAPRVRIVGPHGERFVTPAAASALKTNAAIITPIDQLHTTYIYLHSPAAGTWRVEPLPGSSTIIRVQTATQLPKPIVHAAVTISSGTASVRWSSPPVPGQRIELVERTSGRANTVQHATAKSHGTVHFTPTDPLATRGSIEAVIFRNGLPRARLTVARYQVKPPARPARVSHLTAKRTAAGLNITWRKVTRAREYIVTVSDGTTTLTRALTKRTALTFTDPPTTALTVTVQARDASQRPGVTATVKVP